MLEPASYSLTGALRSRNDGKLYDLQEAISFDYSHIPHPESVRARARSVARHSLIVALPVG